MKSFTPELGLSGPEADSGTKASRRLHLVSQSGQVYGCVKNVKFFNSEHFILNFPFRWKTLSNSLKQRGREDWKH